MTLLDHPPIHEHRSTHEATVSKPLSSLSIVIPVYNEQANLRPLLERLVAAGEQLSDDYEVIFVDDGSSDGSWSVIRALSHRYPRLLAIRLAQNSGQSAATLVGLSHATGEVIATLDADLQNDPKDLPLLVDKLLEDYDMVCGVRKKRRDNWVKRWASRIANLIRRRALHSQIKDAGCAFRVFRRSVAREFFPFRGMHRFFPDVLVAAGYKVAQVEISHHPRASGRSNYGVWDRAFVAAADLLAVRWMTARRVRPEAKEILR